ncbi:hypothetical protein [Micromonospora sediminicola]
MAALVGLAVLVATRTWSGPTEVIFWSVAAAAGAGSVAYAVVNRSRANS